MRVDFQLGAELEMFSSGPPLYKLFDGDWVAIATGEK
jgi:hypothetical protein